ncbi:type IV secretion system protein VirB8 [Pantoea ananatis]|uniref:virB8 family protein n=1 Tax=Pantoea ananas TaxID=553 RepID=UPI002781A892|nr:type IV secretion system protein [Pantoea ananatis]MDQ1228443.1 type IV secretion system protein VirB8 [Pantoea ananatis]
MADSASVIKVSKTFEQSQIDSERKAKKIGYVFGFSCLVLAVLALTALVMILPLKQTIVKLYTVNEHTGGGQFITSVSETSLTAEQAVERGWVKRYVMLREGYNYFALQHDYDTVQLFNTPDVNNAYLTWYSGPEAPDVVYKKASYIASVEIINIQISDATKPDKLANVRFKKTIRRVLDNTTRTEFWDVRMTFHFEPERKMSGAERLENDLGLTVTSYQRDKEVGGGSNAANP